MLQMMRGRAAHALIATLAALLVTGLALKSGRSLRTALAVVILADLALASGTVVLGADRADETGLRAALRERLGPTDRYATIDMAKAPYRRRPGETYYGAQMRSMLARGDGVHERVRRFDDWDAVAQGHPVLSSLWRVVPRLPDPAKKRLLARAGVRWLTTAEPDPGGTAFEIEGEPPQHLVELPARAHVTTYTKWLPLPPGRTPPPVVAAAFTATTTLDRALVHADVEVSTATCATETTWTASERPGRVTAEVTTACRALVVALEPWAQNWAAAVDGAPSAIVPAEGGMLGTFVGPGRREVRFEYRPGVTQWSWLSFAAWAAALALFARRWRH
jgi:hypothetical protein